MASPPTPCAGFRGFRELGRYAYTDDAVHDAVWQVADQGLQDAMEFDWAREAAAVARSELADAIRAFQFRDLRAKAATDKEERSGMSAAQDQLVHTTTMTAHDVRNRRGKLIRPKK